MFSPLTAYARPRLRRVQLLLVLGAMCSLALAMASASAQSPPAAVRGTYYPKEQGREAYDAEKIAHKHCNRQREVAINSLLYPERESQSSSSERGGGLITLTRTNRHGGYVNLKFTVTGPVGSDFCFGAARGGDGSEYILRSKKDLLGLKLTRHKRFWTGYWIDPRPVKENIIGGERILSYPDDPPFTEQFLAGFRKARS